MYACVAIQCYTRLVACMLLSAAAEFSAVCKHCVGRPNCRLVLYYSVSQLMDHAIDHPVHLLTINQLPWWSKIQYTKY